MARQGQLSIMDITGKTIKKFQKSAGASKVSVSELEKGIYILKATYADRTGLKKLIVH